MHDEKMAWVADREILSLGKRDCSQDCTIDVYSRHNQAEEILTGVESCEPGGISNIYKISV